MLMEQKRVPPIARRAARRPRRGSKHSRSSALYAHVRRSGTSIAANGAATRTVTAVVRVPALVRAPVVNHDTKQACSGRAGTDMALLRTRTSDTAAQALRPIAATRTLCPCAHAGCRPRRGASIAKHGYKATPHVRIQRSGAGRMKPAWHQRPQSAANQHSAWRWNCLLRPHAGAPVETRGKGAGMNVSRRSCIAPGVDDGAPRAIQRSVAHKATGLLICRSRIEACLTM